jgi:uncharacterized protein (TIRG00374 family)
MKRFLYAVVLLLAVAIAITHFAEFEHIADTLRRGLWYWLALALAVEAAYFVNLAAFYRAAFRTVQIEERLPRLLVLALAANFANVATATGGLAGIAVFADDARRHGHAVARVTVGGMLLVLSDYAAFLCVLAAGFLVLLRRNSLTAGDLAAAAILVVAAAGLSLLFALGLQSSNQLERALAAATRSVNRLLRPLLRRDYLAEATAHDFATGAAAAFAALGLQSKGRWLAPFAHGLLGKELLIAVLALVFLAFRQPFTAGTLIAGFSLAYLFLIVSPTPSGVGVVEGVMTLALRSLRVPLGTAAVVTLAYRGITFWLPFISGFFALRWLARQPRALTPPVARV